MQNTTSTYFIVYVGLSEEKCDLLLTYMNSLQEVGIHLVTVTDFDDLPETVEMILKQYPQSFLFISLSSDNNNDNRLLTEKLERLVVEKNISRDRILVKKIDGQHVAQVLKDFSAGSERLTNETIREYLFNGKETD